MSAAEAHFLTPDWPAPPNVRAAFTLRAGGVSVAPHDSLNMGGSIGDSLEAVAENRRRVRNKLGLPGEPVWLQQVHGVGVVSLARRAAVADAQRWAPGSVGGFGKAGPVESAVTAADLGSVAATVGPSAELPVGDASVAWGAGQVCAIRVADCMPVLFAARDGSAVAAAHAGWRGLAGGVLEATVERLRVPASELIAWLGPAIGPANFEVGDEVRAAFTATDSDAASAFSANSRGRWQCDLYALARRRLAAIGVAGVYGGGWCTYADPDRFFSYRRSSQCGRMAALIWIAASPAG